MSLKPPVGSNVPLVWSDFEERLDLTEDQTEGIDLTAVPGRMIDLTTARLDSPAGGAAQNDYRIVLAQAGQTNGSRGDSITSDTANATDHSSLNGIEMRSTGSVVHVEKGSIHQIYRALRTDPYSGGGDVYTESFNDYAAHEVNRKGALAGIAEWKLDILAGKPARAAGHRIIMQEFNALSAYDSATFGVSSPWITTGARGLEILAQGSGAQPLGTGIYLAGAAGYTRAIVLNVAGTERFKVDGAGFVEVARSGAASLAYRTRIDGATADRFSIFADGKHQWLDSAGAGGVVLERAQSGVLKLTNALQLVAIAAASVPNNTIFLDSADNVIKRKDNSGSVAAI